MNLNNTKQGKTKKYNKKITIVLEDRTTGKRTPMDVWICPNDWKWISGSCN